MKAKHVPMRRCAACRTSRSKAELIRVVRTPEGKVVLDPAGRMPGRGVYVCRCLECAQAAVRRDVVRRALGVATDQRLAEELVEGAQGTDAARG